MKLVARTASRMRVATRRAEAVAFDALIASTNERAAFPSRPCDSLTLSGTAMRSSVLCTLLLPFSAAAAQVPVARLDSIFAEFRGTDRPGCSVAVSRAGQLIASRGYGMADLSQGTPITPESIFHIASVSKQFTAMTLILLAQTGKFSLDDDVRKWLPEIPSSGPTITTRHFLTNTSGIRDQWTLLMTAGWRLGDDLITEQDVLEMLSRQRGVNFAPGTD